MADDTGAAREPRCPRGPGMRGHGDFHAGFGSGLEAADAGAAGAGAKATELTAGRPRTRSGFLSLSWAGWSRT